MLRRLPTILAVLIVLAAYAFSASRGTFDFPRITDWKFTRYASLAEGFRQGHLYLEDPADPRLLNLPYPWDKEAREGIWYLWDMSFFNGRYYMYFTALPVLLFYLPFRLVIGSYPADALATAFFAAWAFLAMVFFTRRSLEKTLIPFPIWVLLLGLGSVAPFVITVPQMYEISILSGSAMTAMWAVALLAFETKPTPARVALLSIWLALSIAARPNLGMLLFVSAWIVFRDRAAWLKRAIAFFTPLAITALAMIWYNAARFHEPFEFGHKYQLTHTSMQGKRVCSVRNLAEVMRAGNHTMHYLFWPPTIRGEFPYVDLPLARLDRDVSYPTPNGETEQMGGILPLVPLTLAGFALAVFFAVRRSGPRPAMYVMAGAALILLGLSSCWWVVVRYSLDFMFLMVAASIVLIEAGLAQLRDRGFNILPLKIAVIALALYSILIGALLGLVGPGNAFRRANPELFEKIQRCL